MGVPSIPPAAFSLWKNSAESVRKQSIYRRSLYYIPKMVLHNMDSVCGKRACLLRPAACRPVLLAAVSNPSILLTLSPVGPSLSNPPGFCIASCRSL